MAKIITSDELQRWIRLGRSFTLLDVLPSDSYNKMHLPYAVNISVQEHGFEHKINELVQSNKNETIVIYGQNGTQDALYMAGIKLMHAGYDDVYEFKGGMNEWLDMGLPLVTTRTGIENLTCIR